MNRFKPGDLVTCSESHEIEQPMTIVGMNPWYDSKMGIYHVKGKHKRNGSEIVITLSDKILKEYVAS